MIRQRGKSRSETPATPTPPSTPAESFIQKKLSTLHRGDVKMLAASSIVVASSIGSPALNQRDPLSPDQQNASHTSRPDGVIGQESSSHRAADSAWQTAYSTAKMVVDITKESSDMFLPLKAVVGALSVLIKNYDQTMSNTRQVEEIEERVLSLSDILRSPLREGDRSERARRELLCRRLIEVLEKLEPLSEQNGLLKFLRNEGHAGLLSGFIQDIARAVTDYQISLQQSTYEVAKDIDQTTKGIAENTAGIFHKAREIIESTDLEVLDKLNPVRDAGYQAEHHERCLSRTRESILKGIMHWAQNTQDQPVYWLNGLAGTGKSTIAQTFSEIASNHGILGASFFCSRDYLDRKVLKNIFPTLGYQLACRYSQFRDHLVKVIKQDPCVVHNSLISQLKDLLVDPLSSTGISCVIVIDALDECVDDQPASAILSVLGRLVSKLPLVKFFITGRPEPRIRSGFRLPLLEPFTQIFLLHEVDPTSIGGDIRLYLTEKLTSIAKRRSGLDLPEAWPSDKDITALVKKSSGLFIFASTVARFIESEYHEPRERLRLIVSKIDDTSHEGASGIDSLYSQTLCDAFLGIDEESVFVDLKRILSAVVLALNPLSRDGLVQLLNISSTVISTRLRHLHSVLLVPADGAKEIRVFHKSFPDFLQDPERCRDSKFHIHSKTRHGDMALSCLDLVVKLKRNPCALPPFAMNNDVPDCQQLLRDKLGSGLLYACKYWSTHLSFSPLSEEYRNRLITLTSQFFDRSVFPWMEVMSLDGHLEGVIYSMNHLSNLIGWDEILHHSTQDCLRFTFHFFRPIQMSAQHIYHTALPLSPETSILRLRFFENHPTWEEEWTMQQVSSSGVPLSPGWGQIRRTIKADSGSFTHVTVAGQTIIAVCNDNTVNAYDAVTGALKLSLDAPHRVAKAEGSPDESILFFAGQNAREITTWDMQTGGLIYTLTTTFEISNIAVSSKGKYLASCSSAGTFHFWEVESRREGSHSLSQEIGYSMCWLEPEDQIALVSNWTWAVVILEVTTGKKLRAIHVGWRWDVQAFAFKSTSTDPHLAVLLASGTRNVISIIDTRKMPTIIEERLDHKLHDVSDLTFSGDEDRVMCVTKAGDLLSCRYKPSMFNWEYHRRHLGTIRSVNLLRSGHLVVNSGGSIQLLEGKYEQEPPTTSPNLTITRISQLDGSKAFCGFSRDEIRLLDMETMKTLAHFRVEEYDKYHGYEEEPLRPRLVLASRDQHIFVLYSNDSRLVLFNADSTRCGEIGYASRPALLGALSPNGTTLVTINGGEDPNRGDWELCAHGLTFGTSDTIIQKGRPPTKIAFTSETEFYIEGRQVFSALPLDEDKNDCQDNRAQMTLTAFTTSNHSPLHPRKSVIRKLNETTISTTRSEDQSRTGARHKEYCVRKGFSIKTIKHPQGYRTSIKIEEVPGEEVKEEIVPVNPPYALDENLEWVLDAKSRRVFWVPPGYIHETEDAHFFVGSSIAMAGQDKVVRKLTFKNPGSDL